VYEVHPEDTGLWVLYETGDGARKAIGFFVTRETAELCRELVEKWAAENRRSASPDEGPEPPP
jgi:hypothetical protein